jgi:ComF family protein
MSGLLAEWRMAAARSGSFLLDAVLPPRCLVCGAGVDRPQSLCGACWGGLAFLDGPACAQCGLPFEHEVGEGALCGVCLVAPPPFRRARAALRYDEASRGLILAFKHGDRIEGAKLFGRWVARAAEGLGPPPDLVVPVPLHPFRLFLRLYNQSALLAAEVARRLERPVVPDLLRRVRWTPSQAGRDAAERHANVRRAFAVAPRWRDAVADRRVLLIDDVFTTGATVEACVRALRESGAAAVDVATLARVVRPSQAAL